MDLIRKNAVLEEILDAHAEQANGDERGYAGLRAHAYRVLNFSVALAGPGPDHEEKLAIAAGFHDIGAFRSLDYLGPSITTMTRWLDGTGRAAWAEELSVVCAYHHKATTYRGPHATLTEAFRRADWCDVLFCTAKRGVPKALTKQAVAAFPRGVFLSRTVPAAVGKHVVRHPLDPIPILRGGRALRQNGINSQA